jgi:ABC-type branched-subunit amino acid transport system substrate-binding protein
VHSHTFPLPAAMVVASSVLMLAACGSQLSPEEVRTANAGAGIAAAAGDAQAPGGPATSGPVAPGQSGGGSGASGGTEGSTGGSAANAPATSGGSGAAGGGAGTGAGSAVGTTKAGNCAGLKNQTGITDKEIVIANASDISGPVPGLFEAAQEGVKAYVAYFNATQSLCGRKLRLLALDTRSDAGGDQQAYAKACEQAFAAVGSTSAFDSGGAATAEKCGLPDIRAIAITPERGACSTCFGTQSVNPSLVPNAVLDYFHRTERAATQKAAFLHLNAGGSPTLSKSRAEAARRRGFRVVYEAGIDVSEFNYSPYVQQMKQRGVRFVDFLGAYPQAVRLAQAMQQQGFKPDVFELHQPMYDSRYIQEGGQAVEGSRVFINTAMFEEASSNPEMRLYEQWLQQVKPGAKPTPFGVYAWSATRLFVEQSTALGGRLSRSQLVAAMRKVHSWTGNGIHAPQDPGGKRTGECQSIVRVEHGRWVKESPGKFMCSGLTNTGIGG